jgi:hypothetical protein
MEDKEEGMKKGYIGIRRKYEKRKTKIKFEEKDENEVIGERKIREL